MKVARREKYFIWIAVSFITVFLLFELVVFPFFDGRKRIERSIMAKEAGLAEIVAQSAVYRDLKQGARGIEETISSRNKGFTLFSFLEGAAGEAGVKDHIKYMKPSVSRGTGGLEESTVEMKLEGIALKQLVGYLYHVESPEKAVSIKRISISESKREAGYLDAVLQVLTFEQP